MNRLLLPGPRAITDASNGFHAFPSRRAPKRRHDFERIHPCFIHILWDNPKTSCPRQREATLKTGDVKRLPAPEQCIFDECVMAWPDAERQAFGTCPAMSAGACHAGRSPLRPGARVTGTRMGGHRGRRWWAVLGSNQRPKDYAYHFGFRRPFPVRGLDSVLPFGLPVESLHVPATGAVRSSPRLSGRLRSASARRPGDRTGTTGDLPHPPERSPNLRSSTAGQSKLTPCNPCGAFHALVPAAGLSASAAQHRCGGPRPCVAGSARHKTTLAPTAPAPRDGGVRNTPSSPLL